MIVRYLDTWLARFFIASLALHSLIFSLFYVRPRAYEPRQETIPVSVLPAQERAPSQTARVPRTPPRRPINPSAIIAKKDSPVMPQRSVAAPEKMARNETAREELKPANAPVAREPIQEKSILAERQLPTVKELLPPIDWSSGQPRSNAPVSLNTQDPVYISYFNKIKQSIESQWEYPEIALRYGLQGRLALEFTISGSGRLEQVRLIRSSGSQLLDEEAVRAIRAAAPFPPIPPWIKSNPLSISASMEYHDNRLNSRFNPGG